MNRIEKLWQILFSAQYIRGLRLGVAAGVEHAHLLGSLVSKNIKTFVDIGANRGQFALVARKYFPRARIISFEPLQEPAAIFRWVFRSDPLVVLHEIAIGAEEKSMPIHVSRADDSSSLLPITPKQTSLYPGTGEKEMRTVQVKPLDTVLGTQEIEAPAFLKIDVQGFEREVLEGCKTTLSSFSYILVECSFVELYAGQALAHEVISLLEGAGFTIAGIYNLSYDKAGIAVQGDFLFERRTV